LRGKKIVFLVLAVVLFFGCETGGWWTRDDGRIVARDPVQKNLLAKQELRHNGYSIFPQADFEIEARVLSRHRYFFGKEADLAPVDLALGWRRMSDCRVLKSLKITQRFRWYYYRWKDSPPIPPTDIISQSANMHLIPATPQISRRIKKARRGDIVRFSGALVNVSDRKGWQWNSSLTRTDTGDHSCEVVWVEEFEIIPHTN
jgi:hypothetical protein